MEIIIDFPGGSRVDAHFGKFTVPTDQPPAATAPTPFDLFLSSIGTCAGIYVLGFCQQRGLPTDGIQVVQVMQVVEPQMAAPRVVPIGGVIDAAPLTKKLERGWGN